MTRDNLIIVLVAISCLVASSQAIDLVEMNDKNQASLLLPLAKTLEGVQSAYRNGFNFESIKSVNKFLEDCAYVKDVISESSDDDFEGLAKQIKLIMAEPKIATACLASPKKIEKAGLVALDNDYTVEDHDYLSTRKTSRLEEMKEAVEKSRRLSAAVGNLLNKRISDLAEASLTNAVETINMLFDDRVKQGFFDFDVIYKSTCEIQKIKPICKLVRRSSNEDITATSQDVADFIELVQANDEAKLNEYRTASGVNLGEVKNQCARMRDNNGSFLRPIEKIIDWIVRGLMSEEDFQKRLTADNDLAFYNELNKLCKLVK